EAVAHDLDHPLDLRAQLGPERGDRRSPALQHRVAPLDDVGERRFAPLEQLRLELAVALLVAVGGAGQRFLAHRFDCMRRRRGYLGSTSTPIATARRLRSAALRSTTLRTASIVASRPAWALIRIRRRWRLRTRNIGAGP